MSETYTLGNRLLHYGFQLVTSGFFAKVVGQIRDGEYEFPLARRFDYARIVQESFP